MKGTEPKQECIVGIPIKLLATIMLVSGIIACILYAASPTVAAGHTESLNGTVNEGIMQNLAGAETLSVQYVKVAVSGRRIMVNGAPFTIKGVGYSPTPIGYDPDWEPHGDYLSPDYKNIYNRDLPYLRSMGANTIRLWGWNNSKNHTDFLNRSYNKGVNPVYVIVTFWMDKYQYPDLSSPEVRTKAKEDFRKMVASHKNNSAVLMWAIGNELNANWMYGNTAALFSLVNEMAYTAHKEEGTNYHPVTMPLADDNLISTIAAYNGSMNNLDIWSANIYRGKSFGNLFKDYAAASKKPFIITEYGIDAFDDKNKAEYEKIGTPYQAIYDKALWSEIKANSSIVSGGAIMAYSDEWWKGKYGQARSGCPDYNAYFQSDCGFASGSTPDGYMNEEWWGLMRIVDNGSGPDIVKPRAAYNTFKLLWTPPASVTNLHNITYKRNYINWTWKDPSDTDLSKVVVYLNGRFNVTVPKGKQFYNATGLKNGTWYRISTHTVDIYGNINQTWKNHTAKTAP